MIFLPLYLSQIKSRNSFINIHKPLPWILPPPKESNEILPPKKNSFLPARILLNAKKTQIERDVWNTYITTVNALKKWPLFGCQTYPPFYML